MHGCRRAHRHRLLLRVTDHVYVGLVNYIFCSRYSHAGHPAEGPFTGHSGTTGITLGPVTCLIWITILICIPRRPTVYFVCTIE